MLSLVVDGFQPEEEGSLQALTEEMLREEKEECKECGDFEDEGDEYSEGKKKRKKAWRVTLTAEDALEIYKRRPPLNQVNGKYPHGSMRNASAVAVEYKVSPKTIRDIWNRYSWAKVTKSLWTEQEANLFKTMYPIRGAHPASTSMTEIRHKFCGYDEGHSLYGGAHRPPVTGMSFSQQQQNVIPTTAQICLPPQPMMSRRTWANNNGSNVSYSNSHNLAPNYCGVTNNKRFKNDDFPARVGMCGESRLSKHMGAADSELMLGSQDEISQFNHEVDEMVGQLPPGLFGSEAQTKGFMHRKMPAEDMLCNTGWNSLPRSEQQIHHHNAYASNVASLESRHNVSEHVRQGPPRGMHAQRGDFQQPYGIANSQGELVRGNLEEQIGQARKRLNQLLALSDQRYQTCQQQQQQHLLPDHPVMYEGGGGMTSRGWHPSISSERSLESACYMG